MRGEGSELVLGRYRLERPIGRGGFGRIFLAWQESLDRHVAVKASSAHNRDDASLRERFRREAKLVASINHPNVVTYHDFGVDGDGDLVLVMEYLKGESLFESLRRRGPIPEDDVVRYLKQACEGLRAAHDAGIIHRDVKPSNLFLVEPGTPDERLKVLDFGILRADPRLKPGLKDLTRTDHVIGTPAYLAPEMLLGGAIDGRADQYALALVGIELLTGRRVYGGDSGSDGIMARLEKSDPEVESIAPGLKRGLARVFERALSWDPGERYEDMSEFSLAIGEGVREEPTATTVVSEPTAPTVVGVRGPRAKPRFGSIATAAAVILIGTAVAWFAAWRMNERPMSMAEADDHVVESLPADQAASGDGRRGPDRPEIETAPGPAVRDKSRPTARKSVVKPVVEGREPSRLVLNARPWAEVFLDGRSLGRTPIVGMTVPSGTHSLVFSHPRFGQKSFTKDLAGGRTLNLTVDLSSGD